MEIPDMDTKMVIIYAKDFFFDSRFPDSIAPTAMKLIGSKMLPYRAFVSADENNEYGCIINLPLFFTEVDDKSKINRELIIKMLAAYRNGAEYAWLRNY
jgi:hypothetical protein